MPRYDYMCGVCGMEREITHSISTCDERRSCEKCKGVLTRIINLPHVEGSSIYPFQFWNAKLPGGKTSMEIRNKAHHQEVLAKRGLTAPNIPNWGTKRIPA